MRSLSGIVAVHATHMRQKVMSNSHARRGMASGNFTGYALAVCAARRQPANFTRATADSGIGSYRAKVRVNEAAPCESERKSIA